MIEAQDLTFAYPHQPPVFDGFNWKVARGGSWALLGPSGCGKTTLLYLLAGLLLPSTGCLRVDGAPIIRPRPQTGLILQDYGLLPWATVRQNAELGLRVQSFYGPDGTHAPVTPRDPRGVDRWLERLGLTALAKRYPQKLSGGQRQRAAIARTLSIEPDLLLMDEPFSSLDAPTREDLQNLMLALWGEQSFTMLLVTHSIEEAACMGEKILLMGRPPHRVPRVIDNPGVTRGGLAAGYRASEAYHRLVVSLRAELEQAA